MMDLNPYTEERPDFTTSEYLKTLELHRQSEAQEILVPEFQVTMNDLDDISMVYEIPHLPTKHQMQKN